MNANQAQAIAQTIRDQLRAGTDGYNPGAILMMCWGFNKPYIAVRKEDFEMVGLGFKVNGRHLKGKVEIVLDQGMDMYNIYFMNIRGREVHKIEGVFFDDLTRLVDSVVEKDGFK